MNGYQSVQSEHSRIDRLANTAVEQLYPLFYPVQAQMIDFESRSPGSQHFFRSVVGEIILNSGCGEGLPNVFELAEAIYLALWQNKSMSVPFPGLPLNQQKWFLSWASRVVESIEMDGFDA